MPHIDAHLFNKRGVKNYLTLILDEGDNILGCIKSAMNEHKITEVNIEEAEGNFRDGVINYFERSSYKTAELNGNQIMRVSGNFKMSYGDLYGKMNVATFDKPPLQGTLVRGSAKAGFTLKLSFIQFIDG
ncbi:MAG TPA: DUF296 domain-containing protein [archaeon]|nr:DUF296 domain-containing protein [archaeon]